MIMIIIIIIIILIYFIIYHIILKFLDPTEPPLHSPVSPAMACTGVLPQH